MLYQCGSYSQESESYGYLKDFVTGEEGWIFGKEIKLLHSTSSEKLLVSKGFWQ
jgi:hypothetical protein